MRRKLAKKLGIQRVSVDHSKLTGSKRLAQIERLGLADINRALNQEGGQYVSSDPFVTFPEATMGRHELLRQIHRVLEPRTYFEIGIFTGSSLSLSRAKTIAVDPDFRIRSEINCDLRIFKLKSDDFFAHPAGFAHFGDADIDLAFIDGMHLSEFVLRDFINTEKHSSKGTVIILDDVLPRNNLEAFRIRRTGDWAGDVFKVLNVLREFRPDLVVIPLNTSPTGTLLVTNLDPNSTIFEEHLDAITGQLTVPDPQMVDQSILNREIAVDPKLLLEHGALKQLVKLRNEKADADEYQKVWDQLRSIPRIGNQ